MKNSPSHLVSLEVGESLMLRKQMLKTYKGKEPMQRRALFRTTCKRKGKVCKVVIDSGCIENIVSNEMIEKLKLQKFPHETPYKISWLNDSQSILVSEQALIGFSIGGYKDKVVCDVVLMDCCHVLLGRPW